MYKRVLLFTQFVNKFLSYELHQSQDRASEKDDECHVELLQFDSSLFHHFDRFSIAIVFQLTLRC